MESSPQGMYLLGVDGLELLVGADRGRAEFAADAARLDTAERCRRVGDVLVDPDGAGADPPGHVLAVLGVRGPDRAAEPVVRVVGDADRVVLAVVGDHGKHRAEDLLLGDRGGVVDVGEHRRLDEPAAVLARRAAAAPATTRSRAADWPLCRQFPGL